ncbi:hypothetical protein C8R43DRAFT_1128508 [Mycena crocata]|nr:hypothetical protein C8R43DRAFT_1128508 [Mycena crocata]
MRGHQSYPSTSPLTAGADHARSLKRRQSSRTYNLENRDERNAKKRERMAKLRVSRERDPPELIEERRAAAREAARRYREKNRGVLASKSQNRRNEIREAQRRAEAREEARERRRVEAIYRRSTLGLPLAVPAAYTDEERRAAHADHVKKQRRMAREALHDNDEDNSEEA